MGTTAQLWLEISTVVVRNNNMLDLGTLLGYFCIVACGVCKLPQIQTLYQTRLVGGLSFTSILLELYCHGCQAGFYVSESYPLVEFLEYPLLVGQNFTLLFLIGVVSDSLFNSVKYITAFTTLIAVIGGGFFSKPTILMAMGSPGCTPTSCPGGRPW